MTSNGARRVASDDSSSTASAIEKRWGASAASSIPKVV
jgi:hypothetical protein